MTNEEKKAIIRMREEGMGYKAIARVIGLPLTTVSSFCRKPETEQGFCLQCGAKLEHTPHRKRKKFCSDRCRMLWWHSHEDQINKQAYYTLICQECGKEFISYGNDHRKYCSRKCYADHRRKQKVSGEHAEVLSGQAGR